MSNAEKSISFLPQDDWNRKYGQIQICCFSSSDSMFCFGDHEKKSLTIVETITNFSATFVLPGEPVLAVLCMANNLCAFGLSSGVVGIIFDLDEAKLSNNLIENVRLFDSLQSSKITSLSLCSRERSFYVGTNLGIISKFSCRGCDEVEVTRILELGSPIVQIGLSNDDSILVVSTEIRTVVCDNNKKTFREAGNKNRNGHFGALPIDGAKFILCARPGSRLWRTDMDGKVLNTYQFKTILQHLEPAMYLDEEMRSDNKIISYNKVNKSGNLHFFTKLHLIKGTNYVLTHNKQSIYVFDTQNLEQVEHFVRRFGEIHDVFIDDSNIFIRGVYNTVIKYRIILKDDLPIDGEDQIDLAIEPKETFHSPTEFLSSDDDDDVYIDASNEGEYSNYSPLRISNMQNVDMSDFSTSAVAASQFLSEKLSVETRKLLSLASDRMKQTKLNSILEEMYEESVEQNRIQLTKDTIMVLTKTQRTTTDTKEFLRILSGLDKTSLANIFSDSELELIRSEVISILEDKLVGKSDVELQLEEHENKISPEVAECLTSIYNDHDWNLDNEVSNFVTKNHLIVDLDKLFESLTEGFYCTWSSIVLLRHQQIYEEEISGDSNEDTYLTSIARLINEYDLREACKFFGFKKPFELLMTILAKHDLEYSQKKMVLHQPAKKITEENGNSVENSLNLLETIITSYSTVSHLNGVETWMNKNESLFRFFTNSFKTIHQQEKTQSASDCEQLKNIGLVLVNIIMNERSDVKMALDFCIEANFWTGFILAMLASEEETRFQHFDKILHLGDINHLTYLGFFATEDKCSRTIDCYLTECQNIECQNIECQNIESKFKISLEQIAYEMIESIGIERSMEILMEKSSKFEKGTFSPRFYNFVIRKSLKEKQKIEDDIMTAETSTYGFIL